METLIYDLSIESKNAKLLVDILGVGNVVNDIDFEYKVILNDDNNFSFSDKSVLEQYLDLLEINWTKISSLCDKIIIWVNYEFEEQCNIELTANEMCRMGALNITYCFSAF